MHTASQASLATVLKERRESLGLTLKEIEYDTKIRPQYITALEERRFDALPVDIYLERIVTNYAYYLGIDAKVALKLLRMDKDRYMRAKRYPGSFSEVNEVGLTEADHFVSPIRGSFIFTPKVIAISLAGLLVLLVGGYFYQIVAQYQAAPELTISEPTPGVQINSDNVHITGHSSPGSIVSINNLVVSVDKAGNFQETMNLQEGTNKALIRAQENGKVSEKELVVQAHIPTGADTLASTAPDGTASDVTVKLDPDTTDKSWVRVVADGKQVFEGILSEGKEFKADKYVYLLAGNGAAVDVTYNGIPQGTMGKQGEVVHQVFGDAPPELKVDSQQTDKTAA